jgi:polyisoprenyl-phosphate glycosyltransferase
MDASSETTDQRDAERGARPHVSVVAPIYREEGNVPELVRRLTESLQRVTENFEIVLVEDAGGDRSWDRIAEAAAKDPRVKGLRFSRNFGQHYAITAGLEMVSGDWVVVMDGDLQDRPEVIPDLYAKAQEGYDVVFVERQSRPEGKLYMWLQRTFYLLLRFLAGTEYDPRHGNFSIVSQKVVNGFRSLNENLRFYGGIVWWLGYRRASIPAAHGQRFAGRSVYTLGKRVHLAVAIILAHSDRPLRFAIGIGLVMALLSFVYGLYIVLRAVFGDVAVQGWASLIVSIYFVGGLILFVLGIMGLYIGKLYQEAKHRPLYIVAESIGFEDDAVSPRSSRRR